MSSRDSQRSKVYGAERVINSHPSSWRWIEDWEPDMTWPEVIRLVKRIADSKLVQKRYPIGARNLQRVVRNDAFGRGRGRGWAGYGEFTHWRDGDCRYGIHIKLGRWARQEAVVLHEVAHILNAEDPAFTHGWEFCEILLYLVGRYMSKEDQASLKAAFKSRKVRFTKPRPKRKVSPERRAQLVEQLARAREAKAAKAAAEPAT